MRNITRAGRMAPREFALVCSPARGVSTRRCLYVCAGTADNLKD